jgi:glycerophosphoryl diester phosphodiesterase
MPDSRPRPLLLGHRGARALESIPENTLASFDHALADSCDGFEFDVRLSADGRALVCHDPKTEGVEIAQASTAQLAGLPHLQDVLARYQDRAYLDIELKVAGLEKITADLLHKLPPLRGFVVSSFLPEVLETLHSGDPAIPLGLICETQAELRRWSELPLAYVIPHHRLLTPALMHELKAESKKILVWTVNAPADMRRFADAGVDGIISDETSLLCRTLRR